MKKVSILTAFTICVSFVFTLSACSTEENWVRKTISENYYRFDGDYGEIENMDGLSVEEMMGKLDIYSAFYTAEEYKAVTADNAGSKSGLGISYVFEEGAGVVLHSVIGNSPAKKSGLKAGDVLVSAETCEGQTVNFTGSDDFSDFVNARGEGEEFTLNLSDGNSVKTAKAEYTASYASMYTRDAVYDIEYDGKQRKTVKSEGGTAELPEGAAYIYLSQFYGGAYEEIGDLVSEFNAAGCTALVLDLRDNGGGFVDLMAEIGGLFTAPLGGGKHVAMKAEYKNGAEETAYCEEYARGSAEFESRTVKKGTPVYVMANGNTASASEALIGILVSYDILKYENIFLSGYEGVKPRTYGKGIMQSVFRRYFSSGPALKLTVAGIFWQNGKTIHGKGLTEEDGCSVAPSSDRIVNVGYDDELSAVIAKIGADRAGTPSEISA